MTDTLTIALAQINPLVGDVDGNMARLRAARAEAAALGADLVVTPELFASGYPPEDLVLKSAFIARVRAAVEALARETADGGPGVLVGAPWPGEARPHNAALLLDGGGVTAVVRKHHLPNYGVFDEQRVFAPGPCPGPVAFRGVRLGVMVCEDMWFADVAECLEESGAEALVVLNGSPFELDKADVRLNHAVARVTESRLPLIYVNQVGGQDELAFDGASFALDARCRLKAQAPAWREAVLPLVLRRAAGGWEVEQGPLVRAPEGEEAVYQAMMVGLRDYVGKNGFPGVIIGLSGGIDSALTAAVAVDALGPDKVWCVMMPSPYTSAASLEDAAAVARLCGARLDTIGIEPAMRAFAAMLAPRFEGTAPGIAEENIQSRARGLTLMALSNKFGHMVLSTGNKSEMSVGYATLYGDMCGGFNPLKDVYKTTVYALSRWRNAHRPEGGLGPGGPVMPAGILTKAPSAELKPDQTDQDTLPPYEVLDAILKELIENEASVAEVAAKGHDEAVVRRVWGMVDRAEYKRRQAPPGVKITPRAFGRDRRYPITNGFTRLA